MLFLALRLQAITHASFKVPSVPTAQDVSARKQFKMALPPLMHGCFFPCGLLPRLQSYSIYKKPRGPVGNVLQPRVIRGTTAINIPFVKGGSEYHNLTGRQPMNIQSR